MSNRHEISAEQNLLRDFKWRRRDLLFRSIRANVEFDKQVSVSLLREAFRCVLMDVLPFTLLCAIKIFSKFEATSVLPCDRSHLTNTIASTY